MPGKLRSYFYVLSLLLVAIVTMVFLPGVSAYQSDPRPAVVPVNYYIDPVNGVDTLPNDGLSPATAFKTIQKAADLTNPGDTVYLMNGTYTDRYSSVFTIKRSGSAGAYITYKNYPSHNPKLHATNAWNHILVSGASYIKIEGLEIFGDSDSITYDYAYSQKDIANPRTNTNGIYINVDANGVIPHHIEVRNNRIYKCPGAGIASKVADYLTVEDNIIYSTSWWTRYGTSGISFLNLVDTDNYTGYKNFIRRNITYDNEMFIPFYADGKIQDGNGIIIDRNDNTTNQYPQYNARTLIENNLTYNNGGSGIHAFRSSHVDIVNNTAYQNNRSPVINEGNIFANYSSDVNILNNISYARSGKRTNINTSNSNVTYNYNVYFNGTTPAVQGPQDVIADPQFINPAGADFRLLPSSPAINSGTSNLAPSADFNKIPRPIGSTFDRGAFEFVPAPSLSQAASPATFIPNTLSTLTFSLSNPTLATLSNVAFSETFPNQVLIANPNNLTNNCGGSATILANPGSSSFSLTGLTLNPNQSCTISLKLTSSSVGSYNLTTSPITTTQTFTGIKSNTLTLKVVVPIFQANPLLAGDTFRVGAVKAGNSKTETLRLANVGNPITQLNMTYPTISGTNANRFAIVSPTGDFPLNLAGGTSYNLNISCSPIVTGALSATLSFTSSGPGISSSNQTITLSCNGAYAVTKPQDDGSIGTLSYALKFVAINPGDGIVFELGGATSINFVGGAFLPLEVKTGVTIDVGCTNRLTLEGSSGASSTFTLKGNNYIVGLIFQNIRILNQGTGNQARCTKVELTP